MTARESTLASKGLGFLCFFDFFGKKHEKARKSMKSKLGVLLMQVWSRIGRLDLVGGKAVRNTHRECVEDTRINKSKEHMCRLHEIEGIMLSLS